MLAATTLGSAVGGCALLARAAVEVTAEAAVTATASAFFERVGRDRADVHPAPDGGRRRGDTPGLYGVARDVPGCDRPRLVALLAADPVKAAAWTAALGITIAQIDDFVARTTPVLLRQDALVRNHRFRGGTAEGYPALLQAGTAVLVDPWGRPVVKCGCGNPLTALAQAPDRIKPNGLTPAWKRVYDKRAVVAVTGGDGSPMSRIVLTDLDRPDVTIVRPTGTAGEADTTSERRPKPPSDHPSTLPAPGRSAPTTSTLPAPGRSAPTTSTNRPGGRSVGPTSPSRTAAPPVTLTLSTNTVAVGASYTARAAGFEPGERITFQWTGASTGTIDTVTANRDGTAVISVREGAAPGDYRILARGAVFGRIAAAPLRVVAATSPAAPAPTLTLSTSTVAVGASYTARAAGFRPGERITFRWTGAGSGTITTVTADTAGSASISVREGAAPGDYRIHADGLGSGRTAGAPLRVV
ncbi:DUF6777 domain-containing protein [Embleya sp. NPDC050154]|uniref:DUF6777 domain-containing protein n=1 Tax=Embleya sp. NPDC050154 TaxID=3363988 RepID=UPI0037A4ABAB